MKFSTAWMTLALLIAGPAASQVYKCPDPANNRTVYSDKPCSGEGVQIERKRSQAEVEYDRQKAAAEYQKFQASQQREPVRQLLHPQRLENRIHRIRVEARLELREQLPWHRRDVRHARHRQQDPLGAGIERHLQALARLRACVIVPPRLMSPMTAIWLCTGLPSAAEHSTMKLARVKASGVPLFCSSTRCRWKSRSPGFDRCADAAALALK
jgi:hypothetical protein